MGKTKYKCPDCDYKLYRQHNGTLNCFNCGYNTKNDEPFEESDSVIEFLKEKEISLTQMYLREIIIFKIFQHLNNINSDINWTDYDDYIEDMLSKIIYKLFPMPLFATGKHAKVFYESDEMFQTISKLIRYYLDKYVSEEPLPHVSVYYIAEILRDDLYNLIKAV